jgi:hypothetical protein
VSTKADILSSIQAIADATGVDEIKMIIGTPSSTNGKAWAPEPKVFSVLIEGLAGWLDSSHKAKINELVAGYNQLIADYNSSTVPTTAPTVSPLA